LLTTTISNLWITEPSDYQAAPRSMGFAGLGGRTIQLYAPQTNVMK